MGNIDYQHLEQSPADDDATPKKDAKSRSNQLVVLALMVAIGAIALRAYTLRDPLQDMIVNPVMLQAAMRAAGGTPISTVAAANKLAGRGRTSGFQTRAMSIIAQRAGQETTAEAWLKQGLADADSAYLAQFELCLLYWNQGRRDLARESCRGTKDSALYWLNHGYVADQDGDKAEALAAFQMASSIDPELTEAWHQLGHALYIAKRYSEAIPVFERVMALEAQPEADVFYSLGESYLQVDNLKMARDVLDRGLERYPTERVYYLGMAETFRREGDLDTAESWYVRMLQRWPNDHQAWANRGEIALAGGRSQDAEGYFREATIIQPQDVGYWISLAMVAAETGDYSTVVEAYNRATALRPDDVSLWLQYGRYLVVVGRLREAKPVYERVLELEPDNREAAFQLDGLNGEQP